MIRAAWKPYVLDFCFEARTSRAVMHTKDTYFVQVWDDSHPEVRGTGECALFRGLSREDDESYESILEAFCADPSPDKISSLPSSAKFGVETAFADLANGGEGICFPGSEWTEGRGGIPINGLVWMGDHDTMYERIRAKLDDGFSCLKLKIGGIRFEEELDLLRYVRSRFSPDVLELRLDANGAFSPDEALSRLDALSAFHIHSIEQPIRAGQYDAMSGICASSPIAVALDEELIGDTTPDFKRQLLDFIRPAYVILKPALCGGFSGADGWIEAAEGSGTGWWATSALESNIGLSAIAQWVACKGVTMCQGLGTGELYLNNFPSKVNRRGAGLYFDPSARRIVPQL